MSNGITEQKVNWELSVEDISVVYESLLPHVGDIYYASKLATFYRTIFSLAEREVSVAGYAEIKMESFRFGLYSVYKYFLEECPHPNVAGHAMNTADFVLMLLQSGLLHSMDYKFYLKHIECMKLVG